MFCKHRLYLKTKFAGQGRNVTLLTTSRTTACTGCLHRRITLNSNWAQLVSNQHWLWVNLQVLLTHGLQCLTAGLHKEKFWLQVLVSCMADMSWFAHDYLYPLCCEREWHLSLFSLSCTSFHVNFKANNMSSQQDVCRYMLHGRVWCTLNQDSSVCMSGLSEPRLLPAAQEEDREGRNTKPCSSFFLNLWLNLLTF